MAHLPDHVDVLIVGAGISGIGVAAHLTMQQPGRTFAVLEARDAIGGTWDLFRYPGIRSDSDLHTFGYEFKPWTSKNAIADGDEILSYLHETVREYHLGDHIHLGCQVVSASFATETSRWTVTVRRTDGHCSTLTCGWLFSAAGYYDYDAGHAPTFDGQDDFAGPIIHPQAWPEDLDYTGKDIVVIGSGATAVTLVPALAERAGRVTMLQRSPTYVIPVPRQDPIAGALNRALPTTMAYRITRMINIARFRLIYGASQRYPRAVRRLIRRINTKALPDGYAVDTHFNPAYNPCDQRMCTVPDGDFFDAISRDRAAVVTERITRLTPGGILLDDGDELKADIVVTATGLRMVPFGKLRLVVDGESVELPDRLIYKGMMVSGVPNFAFTLGYTNSSWTLKVDLVAEHLCRLLAHMDRRGYVVTVPVNDDPTVVPGSMFNMSSGYMQRAAGLFPAQGSTGPWTMPQDYAVDRARLRHGPVDDPALRFVAPRREVAPV